MAFKLQKMRAAAQPLEAKVSGVANPLPWVVEPLQLRVGSSAQPPPDAPAQHVPPNLLAGHMLMVQQLPLPPPRWPHLFLGGLPLLPILLLGGSKPALCPFWPDGGYSTSMVGALPQALELIAGPATLSPQPPALFQPSPAKSPAAPAPVQAPNL